MSDETEMLGESDWDDQDLLTLDEAGGRLDEEIDAIKAMIVELTDRPDAADRLEAVGRRLADLIACQQRIAAGATPLAQP